MILAFIAPIVLSLQAAQQPPPAGSQTAPTTPPPSLAVPAPPDPDKVVITVNGKPIKAKELSPYLWDWGFASQVGQALITLEELEQEAEKRGIKITDADVSAKFNEWLKQTEATAPKGTNVLDVMKGRGYTPSRIGLGIRGQLLVEKLAALDFKPDNYVRVATIVIRPKDETAAAVAAASKSAQDAYAALQKGGAWDAAVTQYATDQRAAANHGEIGWVPISQFPPEVQKELPNLKANGFTQPVQTPNGMQIFRLEARGKDATPGDLSEIKTRLAQQSAQEIIKKLQEQAKVTTNFGP